MSRNMDAAMRRKEKWENKQKRQEKILIRLGILAAVVVLLVAVFWVFFSMDLWEKRALSEKEKKALFENTDALPAEDDPLVGTWFFFTADGEKIHSKYIFSAEGKLEVLQLDESVPEMEAYMPVSLVDYRVRESKGEIYVWAKDDENAKDKEAIITYKYEIEKKDGAYILTWEYADGTVWKMLRVS